MTKQSFIKGAMILVTASFYNRLLGFVYKIMVVRLVGSEGIGIYEMVFPFYVLILVITSAGVPLAISKLVAEEMAKSNIKGAYKVFYISIMFLTFTGIIVTMTLYKFLPIIVKYFYNDPRVYWSFWVMIPGIFVISVCSAFRGFFQGLQQMTPTAVSQVIEQSTRFVIGLWCAKSLIKYGVEFASMGMAIGMIAGEMVGIIIMIIFYITKRPKVKTKFLTLTHTGSMLSIIKAIFYLAFPITLTRIVYSTSMTLQASLVPQRLQAAGFSLRQSTEIFGQYSGIAVTLLHLPTMVTISLAITLVPAISEALSKNNNKLVSQRINQALRITFLLGLPSMVIFLLFPFRLSELLFDTPQAGTPLKILGWGAIFLYLQQTTTGILQGLGRVKASLYNAACGASVSLIGVYYLTAIPTLGIQGTAIAANIGAIIVSMLNLLSIIKSVAFHLNFKQTVLLPLTATFIMGFTAFQLDLYLVSYSPWMIIPILSISGILYIILLILMKAINIKRILNLFIR